jgi:hypothetical protein
VAFCDYFQLCDSSPECVLLQLHAFWGMYSLQGLFGVPACGRDRVTRIIVKAPGNRVKKVTIFVQLTFMGKEYFFIMCFSYI